MVGLLASIVGRFFWPLAGKMEKAATGVAAFFLAVLGLPSAVCGVAAVCGDAAF